MRLSPRPLANGAADLIHYKAMCMLDRVRERRKDVARLAERNKISKVLVFGSCARKEERPDSDIDFLVDFKPNASLFDHVHMRDDLSDLFGVKVDVVSSKGLDPFVASYLMKDAVEI